MKIVNRNRLIRVSGFTLLTVFILIAPYYLMPYIFGSEDVSGMEYFFNWFMGSCLVISFSILVYFLAILWLYILELAKNNDNDIPKNI